MRPKGNEPTPIETRPSGVFINDPGELAKLFGDDFSSPAYDALIVASRESYDDFLREFMALSPRRKVHVLRFISMFDEMDGWEDETKHRQVESRLTHRDILPSFFRDHGWGVGHFGRLMVMNEDLGPLFHHMMKNPSRLRFFCPSIVYNPHLPPWFRPEIVVMSKLRYFHDSKVEALHNAFGMFLLGGGLVGNGMDDFARGVVKGRRLSILEEMNRDEEAATMLLGCEAEDELHGMLMAGAYEFMEYRRDMSHKDTISTISAEARILSVGRADIASALSVERRRSTMPPAEISRICSVDDWSRVMTMGKLAEIVGGDVIIDVMRALDPLMVGHIRVRNYHLKDVALPIDIVGALDVCSSAGGLVGAYVMPAFHPMARNFASMMVGKMMSDGRLRDWISPLKGIDLPRAFDLVMDAYPPSDIEEIEDMIGEIGSRTPLEMRDVSRALGMRIEEVVSPEFVFHGTSLERFINGKPERGAAPIRDVGLLSPKEMGDEEYELRSDNLDKVFYSVDPLVAMSYAYRAVSQDAARGISTTPIIIWLRFEGDITDVVVNGLGGGFGFSRWMFTPPAEDFVFSDPSHVICALSPMNLSFPHEQTEDGTIPADRIDRISHLPLDPDDGRMVVERFFPSKPVLTVKGDRFCSKRIGRMVTSDPTRIEMVRGVAFDDDEIEACRWMIESRGVWDWS